jgi:hypothetical protein
MKKFTLIFVTAVQVLQGGFPPHLLVLNQAVDKCEPRDFAQMFTPDMLPKENESFKDNELITFLPHILERKDKDFKNSVLDETLARAFTTHDKPYLSGLPFLVVALIEAGADRDRTFHRRVLKNNPAVLIWHSQNCAYAEEILSRGANPHESIQHDRNIPLICEAKSVQLASILENHGAIIRSRTQPWQETVLHQAMNKGYEPGLLDYYTEHGLTVNVKNLCDETPFHALIKKVGEYMLDDHYQLHFSQKAEKLLKHGADLEIKSDGKTVAELLEETIACFKEKSDYKGYELSSLKRKHEAELCLSGCESVRTLVNGRI